MTAHLPQPGSLAEAVESRAEAVAYAREHTTDGNVVLGALMSLLIEISEADDAGELPEPFSERAESCAGEILDLCAELAGEPGADLVELAGTVGAAIERLGWIHDTAPLGLVRRGLGLFGKWFLSDSTGVVLECGRAAEANIGLLADEDHTDEALMHSQRRLLAYERHFATDPALFRWHLADAHDSHAHLLVRAGLRNAAIAHAERAVDLAAGAEPDEHDVTGRLAPMMRSLIGHLRVTGDHAAANAATERLAEVLAHAPAERARTLAGLRDALSSQGDPGAAIAAAERTVAAWDAVPDERARSVEAMRSLAWLLSGAKRHEEAVEVSLRALRVIDQAHDTGKSGLRPVATTLRQVVCLLLRAGRHGEALAHSDRELAAWRKLFDTMGTTHHQYWAYANNNRAVALNHLDRHAESLEHSATAVAVYDLLAASDPRHRSSLANALFNRHATLRDLRDLTAASTCTQRMIAIYRDLAEADPDDHRFERADALKVHAGLLAGMGRLRPAMSWSRRAMEQFDELVARRPGEYDAVYADATTSHLTILQAAGEAPRELLKVSGRAVELEAALDAAEPGARWSEYAMALTNHSICLSAAGRPREAVEAAADAVATCPAAPASRKDMRRRAECLDQYGVRLDTVGRNEEALECSTEAMAIYDELLAADRGLYLADAAGVRDNDAAKLAKVGRLDEAISRSWESVAMYAELSAEGLERKGYGIALMNLAGRLKAADRAEEAIEPSAHALRLREELAAAGGPDLRGDLGQAHLNHAHALGLVGDAEGALRHATEAVKILDAVTEIERAAYLPVLAQAVHNLAYYQDGEESAETSLRAVELRDELVDADRGLYLTELAASLKYAAKYHDRVGRSEEAEGLARREIAVAEELAEDDPAWLPTVVGLRRALASRLMWAGRRAEAVEPVRAAAELAGRLAGEDRSEHLSLLRDTLTDLAWILCDGEPEAALDATAECLELARELDGGDHYDLAHALDGHGSMLAEFGRHEEALEHYDRSLPLWETIAADGRDSAIADLAWCLTYRSISLAATGGHREALEESARAVELYTELGRWRSDLAFATREHALRLHAAGRDGEAREAAAAALARFEELMPEAPARYRPLLAQAQLTAAIVGAGDSRDLAERAVATYREAQAADPGAYAAKVRAAEEFLGAVG